MEKKEVLKKKEEKNLVGEDVKLFKTIRKLEGKNKALKEENKTLKKEIDDIKFFTGFVSRNEFMYGMDDPECLKKVFGLDTIWFRAVDDEMLDPYCLVDIKTKTGRVRRDMVLLGSDLGECLVNPVKFCEDKGVSNLLDGYKDISPLKVRKKLRELEGIEYQKRFTEEDFKLYFGDYMKRIVKDGESSYTEIGQGFIIQEPERQVIGNYSKYEKNEKGEWII